MRKAIVCFMILSLTCLVYAESGFLLDKFPFKKGKTKQIKKDDQADKKADKSGAKLPKKEQKKTVIKPKPVMKQSLQQRPVAAIMPEHNSVPASPRKSVSELSKPADKHILMQRAIALQQQKNELAQLEQQLLKIQCEKEKIKLEIESLKTLEAETKTSKPTYVSTRIGARQGATPQSFFSVLMISSVDGIRAYVVDNGVTYYTHKGEKVSRGTVKNITSEGIYLDEKGETVFYPVSH